ncbi:MAG: Nif11-like leader peptide family natural product precursor [Lentisphaeria bacterium]|nr:Nif11-like leader peptide family natural product precursor [Lentisphaeria bacterium]
MSIVNVERFYELLEVDQELRAEALKLQTIYEEQEDVLDAFLEMAEKQGLPFTEQEFMAVMYQRAMSQPDPE